ncbi:MAG: hypothetical protein AB8B56_21185 [Crocinitomicaceae bacterium]
MGLFSRRKKKKQAVNKNPYQDMREMAFNMSWQELGLEKDDSTIALYGVIMDWDMGSGIVTLVAYSTGDTSLYMSSGAGFIGAGRHEDVNQLVQGFISESASQINHAQPDDSRDLPTNGDIIFHFLTTQGKFSQKDNIGSMEDQTSPNLPYFEAANQVITAIRIASERK